jgi:hypothetical protein
VTTEQRLELISDMLLSQPMWAEEVCDAAYDRLLDVLSRLGQQVHIHMLLEDSVLLPLVVGIEHPEVLTIGRSRAEIEHLVARVADEHRRIRRLVDELHQAVVPIISFSLLHPQKSVLLVGHVATLALLLREQLTLEDSCLWPRALELFRALP